MADVLNKLFEGEIPLENFIQTLIDKNNNKVRKRAYRMFIFLTLNINRKLDAKLKICIILK